MFNKNLRSIRLQQGLSQKQVADYLSISPQSISKWEKGEALPSIEFLPKLAECLKCDINAFFKPIHEEPIDLDLLSRLLDLSYEYIFNQKEVDEAFNAFFVENPNALDVLTEGEAKLKKYQTVKNKTIQSLFDCSESQAAVLIDYLLKHELIEKLDNDDSYFVLRDNIGGLRIVLKTMLELCAYKFK